MEIATYWDNMYKVKGQIWGSRHTEAAELSAQFFKERQVKSVLEIGCGDALVMKKMSQLRPDITFYGMDIAVEPIGNVTGNDNIAIGIDRYCSCNIRLPVAYVAA